MCKLESRVKGVHTVHAVQLQLLHEALCVLGVADAEQLACSVGLPCGEHAAHGVRDMEMQRHRRRRQKQPDKQFL